MNRQILDDAAAEFADAISRYESIESGLGVCLKEEVKAAVAWIAEHPRVAPPPSKRMSPCQFGSLPAPTSGSEFTFSDFNIQQRRYPKHIPMNDSAIKTMESSQIGELTRRTAAILAEKMGAESVWLFGSYARGDAGPDSDLDFLVVVPHSEKTRYERAVEAHRALGTSLAPMDIIVLTKAEWDRDLPAVCSLGSTVLREGIRLL